MFDTVLLILLIIAFVINSILFFLKRRHRESFHHVIVKFVGGTKTKLVLNDEQHEQLQAFLNQVDGHFEICDDLDNVKLYREHICAVEVKKK